MRLLPCYLWSFRQSKLQDLDYCVRRAAEIAVAELGVREQARALGQAAATSDTWGTGPVV